MKLMKVCAPAAAALSLGLALVAGSCVQPAEQGGGGAQNRAPKKAGERVRLGFSMDTLKEERWQRDKEHVEQYAREAGADLEVQVANGDDAAQTKQCETMLTKGVDVLIVAPHNAVAAAAIVSMAKQRGVPVISYDRLIRNSEPALYVSHQVVKIGEMQGKYALDRVPRGNYLLIQGAPTDNNAKLLHDGQMNVLKPAIDSKAINVIADLGARDWLASEAQRITEDAVTRSGGKIDAIVASNDGTAGGAVAGLPPHLVGKVVITGQDAALDAVQRIVEGKQTMTIYKPIKPLAKSAVDAAMQLARGEAVNAPDRINNDKIDVPAILHEPQTVDKDNVMQTVIADGYHKFEDVYKNVPPEQRPKQTAAGSAAAAGVASALFSSLLLGAALFAGVVYRR